MRNPNSKGAKRLNAAEIRRKALVMRRSGATFDLIGQALGVSKQRAHAVITAELARMAAENAVDAEALRALEVDRLDRLLRGLWQRAQDGDLGAVDRALKIAHRRAALLGLDRPTKIAPTTPNGEESYEGGGGLAALLQQQQLET
jgi:hypothetical protein